MQTDFDLQCGGQTGVRARREEGDKKRDYASGAAGKDYCDL